MQGDIIITQQFVDDIIDQYDGFATASKGGYEFYSLPHAYEQENVQTLSHKFVLDVDIR